MEIDDPPAQCSSIGLCSNTHEFRMFGLFYLLEKLNEQGYKVRAPINYDTLVKFASEEYNLRSLPTNWFGLCIWNTNEEELIQPHNFINLVSDCIHESPDEGYVIFPLYLWNPATQEGHENYVLINCKTKEMYRLEPNGYNYYASFTRTYKLLTLELLLTTRLIDFGINISLSNLGILPFKFESLFKTNFQPGPHTSNACGFCLTWAIWMVENFIKSECDYESMMKIAIETPTPTNYNTSVYQWGIEMYTFLSPFLAHAQSRSFELTTTQIQQIQQAAEEVNAQTRSPELIHLSNVVLYYRFCYLLCLVGRMYLDTLSSKGINRIKLDEIRKQFDDGVQGGGGIKKIKGKKQKTRRRRKKLRKHRKVRKSKKHKKSRKSRKVNKKK